MLELLHKKSETSRKMAERPDEPLNLGVLGRIMGLARRLKDTGGTGSI